MLYWIFSKSELRSTPSITNGLTYDQEMSYRKEGARFIMDLGSKMGLRYDTVATGVVFLHRFYMFHSFEEFDRYVTACCCLFLAGKVEETPKKCKDIIKTAKPLLSEAKFAAFGPDPKEEVMTMERVLLQTIKFDLQVEHPYPYLTKYANCLKGNDLKRQKCVQMAWTFVNDSLCTTLCLQWQPEIIAIALMYLAGKLSKFEVVNWAGRQPHHLRWWDMFVEDMSMELLEDICHQVLDLYTQNSLVAGGPSAAPAPARAVADGGLNGASCAGASSTTASATSKPTTPSDLTGEITPVSTPKKEAVKRKLPSAAAAVAGAAAGVGGASISHTASPLPAKILHLDPAAVPAGGKEQLARQLAASAAAASPSQPPPPPLPPPPPPISYAPYGHSSPAVMECRVSPQPVAGPGFLTAPPMAPPLPPPLPAGPDTIATPPGPLYPPLAVPPNVPPTAPPAGHRGFFGYSSSVYRRSGSGFPASHHQPHQPHQQQHQQPHQQQHQQPHQQQHQQPHQQPHQQQHQRPF